MTIFVKIRALLIPIFSALRLSLVGQLAISEMFVIVDSFISIKAIYTHFAQNEILRKIVFAYFVFLLCQLVSDLVNESTEINMYKGCANIIMAILYTTYLSYIFSRDSSLITIFYIGIVIRYIAFNDTNASEDMSLEVMSFFKFRLVPFLNALILVFTYYCLKSNFRNYRYIISLFTIYGLFCLFYDARSNGIFFILTALVLKYRNYIENLTVRNIVNYLVIFSVVGQIIYFFYVSNVLSGNLGGEHSREQLSRIENPYNPINLLITGRAEAVVALSAIADKPVFGHGSWAVDRTGKYLYLEYTLHNEQEKFLEQTQFLKNDEMLIPAHSIILGSWVNAGFVAFIAMMYVYILTLKMCFDVVRNRGLVNNSPFYPLLVFATLNLFWMFLFSAIGDIKVTLPVYLSIIILFYNSVILSNKINDSGNFQPYGYANTDANVGQS